MRGRAVEIRRGPYALLGHALIGIGSTLGAASDPESAVSRPRRTAIFAQLEIRRQRHAAVTADQDAVGGGGSMHQHQNVVGVGRVDADDSWIAVGRKRKLVERRRAVIGV